MGLLYCRRSSSSTKGECRAWEGMHRERWGRNGQASQISWISSGNQWSARCHSQIVLTSALLHKSKTKARTTLKQPLLVKEWRYGDKQYQQKKLQMLFLRFFFLCQQDIFLSEIDALSLDSTTTFYAPPPTSLSHNGFLLNSGRSNKILVTALLSCWEM